MDKFKNKLAEIKVKIKQKLNKATKIKANNVADLLTFISLFIIFGTTYKLNSYIGMYILAIELLIVSYFMTRR